MAWHSFEFKFQKVYIVLINVLFQNSFSFLYVIGIVKKCVIFSVLMYKMIKYTLDFIRHV